MYIFLYVYMYVFVYICRFSNSTAFFPSYSGPAQVQQSAASAMQWLAAHGGSIENPGDTVAQLAKVGAGGRHLNNAERDTHRLLSRMSETLGATVEFKDVRLINPSTLEESVQKLPMILPHHMCLALWQKGEEVFRRCLFGELSEQEIQRYWDHHESHAEWFQGHPARHWNTRGRVASIGLYGDDVQAYRNSECGIISLVGWCSEFSFRNDPLLRYFAICAYSEHHESPNTYNDLVHFVIESFRSLQRDEWPWTQKGYLLSFSFVQGDLKWVCEKMGVFNYRQNSFCSRCFCTKKAEDIMQTLPNFTENPDQFGHRDYSDADLRQFSPLFSLPLTMDRVQHDVAHSQLLGTGKTANGA